MADKKKTLFVEATQLIKHGKYGQASKVLKDLLTLEPSKIEFRRLSASLNLKLGNMMAAKGAYEELVQDALSMRDARLAETMLREYLSVGPRCVPFLELLGKICEDNGNAMVAANEYSKALQILLDDPDAGDADKPDELFRKVKELSPNNPILTQYSPQFEKTQAIRAGGAAALDQTTKLEIPLDQTTKLDIPTDATIKLDIRTIKPTPPTSPLETTLKMKAMKAGAQAAPPAAPPAPPRAAAPPPAAPPAPPPVAVPPPPSPPIAIAPPSPPPAPPRAAAPPPAAPPAPPPVAAPPPPSPPIATAPPSPPPVAPRVIPPPMEELPLVEDDITELISKPIPKRTEVPERPSLAKTILSFFQSAPPPAPEAPPAALEPVAPAPEPPAAAPTAEPASAGQPWQSWQPESTSSPLPPPVPSTQEPQGVPWSPWQPEPTAAAPEPASLKLSQEPASAPPKKGKKGHRSEKKPSLSVSGGMGKSISLGEAAPAAKPRRPVILAKEGPSRRMRALRALSHKAAMIVGVPVGLALLAYVGLTLGSLLLEQGTSEVYQNFSGSPPRSGEDPRNNAYVLLLGFGTDPNRNPMADGFERMEKTGGVRQPQCSPEPDPAAGPLRFSGAAVMVDIAWRSVDPVGQFMTDAPRVQALVAQHAPLMSRYRELLGMKFVDEGFGTLSVPNCALILTAHRVHVAEGFGQGLTKGIERLKQDLTLWRTALSQARTLPIKQMALAAFNDDLTILAGVLNRPDGDAATASDLMALAKPLEQFERSLRWPMQNALAIDAKLLRTNAIFEAVENPTLTVQLLAHLPLPDQRILNRYADYYEALLKATDAPLTKPPTLYQFAKTPPKSLPDYVLNPIDNLVPGRTPVAWDEQVGTVIETDARLRLVALVAVLRGLPRDVALARIALAGPAYYDPFMEITMLLDTSKGKLYSVGKNRNDDDADAILDVAVPFTPKEPAPSKPKKR